AVKDALSWLPALAALAGMTPGTERPSSVNHPRFGRIDRLVAFAFRAVNSLRRKPRDRLVGGEKLARAVAAPLELDLARGQAARATHALIRDPDQVRGCEFCAWPLVKVVVEHLDSLGLQRLADFSAHLISRGVALLEVQHDRVK